MKNTNNRIKRDILDKNTKTQEKSFFYRKNVNYIK